MRLDDGKTTWQDTAARYGPGAALFALGIVCKCAWDHHVAHRIVLPPALQSAGSPDLDALLASEDMPPSAARLSADSPDSLEDALKSLEVDNDDAQLQAMIAEQRGAAAAKSPQASTPAKAGKATKSAKKQKVVSKPVEAPQAKESSKKAKSSKKSTSADSTAAAEDALAKLEGGSKRSTAESQPEMSEDDLLKKLQELFGSVDEDEDPRPPLKPKKKKAKDSKKDEPETIADLDDGFHVDFQRKLQEEREREARFNISQIKKEFKNQYDSHHKPLLCSGCKLVTARLATELDSHSVRDQENPALMLSSVRNAIEATCSSLRHLDVVEHEKGYKFQAGEVVAEDAEVRVGQKLCHSLLEESRFDILTTMMRKKVTTWHVSTSEENWERRLCAGKARFCKRSETQEDNDDDDHLEPEL